MVVLGKPQLHAKFEVASFSRCRNIKWEPQNIGELPQTKATPTFSYGYDSMMCLNKPKLCTKFEVASFSHLCKYWRDLQILGTFPSPEPRPGFLLFVIFMMVIGRRQLRVNFEVASFSRCRNIGKPGSSYSPRPCLLFFWVWFLWWTLRRTKFEVTSSSRNRNIKGGPKIVGSYPSPGLQPLLLLVRFDDGPWKTPVGSQIWSRWFHVLRKYKKICFSSQIRFFEPPIGGVSGNLWTSSVARWKASSLLPFVIMELFR